jgi:hypothetical protein
MGIARAAAAAAAAVAPGSWELQQHRRHSLRLMVVLIILTLITSPLLEAQDTLQLASNLHPTDLGVLRAVKNAMTDLPGGTFFSSWDFSATGIDPCQMFAGVVCINIQGYSRVTLLSLGPEEAGLPGLTGTLPPELGYLPFLTQLSISPGAVSGPIPRSLGRLRNLNLFSCSQNLLTGSIPQSLAGLQKLQVLQLSNNKLAGAIPSGIGSWPSLEFLVLSDNRLTGTIPMFSSSNNSTSTAPRAALNHLDLRNNELTGELMSDNLPSSLEFLSLTNNQFTGSIAAVGNLTKLKYLDLSFNQFSGEIPSSLFGFVGLSYLLLNRNQLSGPVIVKAEVTIKVVDLSFNLLVGSVSPFLAGAQILYLNNNLFMGTIPQEFVTSLEASTLQSLYLQNNYLSNFGDLGTATIPPTVAVCVQYNCELPPPQSICPESQGFVARPLTECVKAAGTHLQILFLFQPKFWMFNGFLSSVAQSFSLNQTNPKKTFLGCWGGLLSLCL